MLSSPTAAPSRRTLAGLAAILVIATLAAYHNTFRGPFLFDDIPAIVDNPTIRHLGSLKEVLLPDAGYGITVSGRPVLNLSLALCHAVSGTGVWSYHAFNLLIHCLAALTLFGVVRQTLLAPRCRHPGRSNAMFPAFAVALLWALHPLQTESVTYVIQRSESLMGLFYLLTLYCFIRGASVTTEKTGTLPCALRGENAWFFLSVISCLLGMGCKEVMVTAPMVVFLYDRTFLAGTFREAWRRRRWLHLSLAATWVPLGILAAGTGWNRGGTAGFDVGVSPWSYWFTQFPAVVRYLRLSFWPHPLVFEYGTFWVGWREAAPYALIVLPLAAATVVALRRRPAAGFLGACFFLILAPTSIVPGTMQMIVEHRMYLPLAAVVAAAVLGLDAALSRLLKPAAAARSTVLCLLAALPLGLLTGQRNHLYRDDLALWRQTVEVSPASAKAQSSLGTALYLRGQAREAAYRLQIALCLDPRRAPTHYNIALAHAALGHLSEAVSHYREVLRINPSHLLAHYQLGLSLTQMGRPLEALAEYAEAVRLVPLPEVHYAWGGTLAKLGRFAEAADHYRTALQLKPGFVDAENDLGTALFRLNRTPESVECFQRTVRARPDSAEAHLNLALALTRTGAAQPAIAEYSEAVRLNPTNPVARFQLGLTLAQVGRTGEALPHLQKAVELKPDSAEARCNLGIALALAGRLTEAIDQYQAALQLRSDYANAHYNLGNTLIDLHRPAEARWHFEAALRIDPQFTPARKRLEQLQSLAPGP